MKSGGLIILSPSGVSWSTISKREMFTPNLDWTAVFQSGQISSRVGFSSTSRPSRFEVRCRLIFPFGRAWCCGACCRLRLYRNQLHCASFGRFVDACIQCRGGCRVVTDQVLNDRRISASAFHKAGRCIPETVKRKLTGCTSYAASGASSCPRPGFC